MKSKRRESRCAKCPFYSGEEAQKVVCEGVWEDTGIHLCFGTPALQREYKKIYCYNSYTYCSIYRSLCSKYEE